jgi:hypothetical protein
MTKKRNTIQASTRIKIIPHKIKGLRIDGISPYPCPGSNL